MFWSKKVDGCDLHPRRRAVMTVYIDRAGLMNLCKRCSKKTQAVHLCPGCGIRLRHRWGVKPLGEEPHAFNCWYTTSYPKE